MAQHLRPKEQGKVLRVRNLYIDGAWTTPHRGQGREVINPFDQSVVAKVAEGDDGDARDAIAAARRAFDSGAWPHTPAAERGRKVYALADLEPDAARSMANAAALLEVVGAGIANALPAG